MVECYRACKIPAWPGWQRCEAYICEATCTDPSIFRPSMHTQDHCSHLAAFQYHRFPRCHRKAIKSLLWLVCKSKPLTFLLLLARNGKSLITPTPHVDVHCNYKHVDLCCGAGQAFPGLLGHLAFISASAFTEVAPEQPEQKPLLGCACLTCALSDICCVIWHLTSLYICLKAKVSRHHWGMQASCTAAFAGCGALTLMAARLSSTSSSGPSRADTFLKQFEASQQCLQMYVWCADMPNM